MLAGPLHWYHELPAAVPDTGPFNPHFVRDIGCAFFAVGVALVWAAFAPRWRAPLLAIAALFLGGARARARLRHAARRARRTRTGGSTCPACTCPRW